VLQLPAFWPLQADPKMSLVPGWPLPPRVTRAGQRIEHEVLQLRDAASRQSQRGAATERKQHSGHQVRSGHSFVLRRT
jgi:hypothetical protein